MKIPALRSGLQTRLGSRCAALETIARHSRARTSPRAPTRGGNPVGRSMMWMPLRSARHSRASGNPVGGAGTQGTVLRVFRRLLICVLGLWSATAATAAPVSSKGQALQAQVEQARLLLEHDAQGACTALQAVVEAPQRGPWTKPALMLFAECNLRLGDLDRADSLWADLEKRDGPTAYAARYHRAELLYFRGDFAAATAALAELATTDPSHAFANDVLALLAVCEEYAASDGLADLSRAQLLERQGQSEAANAHWTALEEGALAEWSLLLRAELRAQQDRLDEAMALYQRQIAHFPQGEHIVAAHLGLAALYERQGAIEQALKTYETALLQHPHDARAPEARLHIERLRHLRESG